MADDDQTPPPAPQHTPIPAVLHIGGRGSADITINLPDEPVAPQPVIGPSVSNATIFVPDQGWQPPPVRRLAPTGFGFDQGTFDAGTFEHQGFVTGTAAGLNVGTVTAPPLPLREAAGIQGAAAVASAGSLHVDTTVTVTRSSVGSTRVENRDAILIKSTVVRLLLTAVIDRAKAERSNSAGIPELEAIQAAVNDLHEMLLATTAIPAEAVNAKIVTFKTGVLNWWDHDHVEIVGNTYNAGLFAALLELSAQVGLVQTVTIAALIKGKDIVAALTALAKILRGDD
jgi:hypothetical protein